MLPKIGTKGKGRLSRSVSRSQLEIEPEKNLDKKMANSVSYAKLWAAVAREFAGRRVFPFGLRHFGRLV